MEQFEIDRVLGWTTKNKYYRTTAVLEPWPQTIAHSYRHSIEILSQFCDRDCTRVEQDAVPINQAASTAIQSIFRRPFCSCVNIVDNPPNAVLFSINFKSKQYFHPFNY